MLTLLAKLFIKDHKNYKNPKVRQAYGMLCGLLGILLNLVLFAGKYLAGVLTGSIAITADAFNNLSDAGSSLITLIGFKMAGQKPDLDHPFGHGRIEYISGLIVAALILLMGFELAQTSFDKILNPEATGLTVVSAIILIASIAIKGYMALYNNRTASKIDSAAMKATGRDKILANIEFKVFDDTSLDITTAQANDWTVASVLVLPAIAAAAGLVIWVRRKHS